MNKASIIWAKNIKVSNKDDREISIRLCEHTRHLLERFDELKSYIPSNLHKSIQIAIWLHDIGKVLPHFQRKRLGNKNYQPFDVEIDIEHSLFSTLLIDKEELKNQIQNNDYANFIISAIAYHHWRDKFENLLRFGSDSFQKLKNKSDDFKNSLIENLKTEMQCIGGFNLNLIKLDEYMLDGLAGGVTFDAYAIPPYQLYFLPQRIDVDLDKKKDWILIAGNLIRCDHFASYCEEDNQVYPIEIDNISFDETRKNIVQKLNNPEIWQIQRIGEYIDRNTILIAPTGTGKTEFAFLWSNGRKLFYTLPIRAAVEQIFGRARQIFNQNQIERVGILHSDADVYLINDENEESSIKLYDNARQLAMAVSVSTGDQFFPYALKPPGYEKIYSTFSYSNLVIDEVQAYEPKASAIVVKYVEDILKMGGKALIMTATFPDFIRKEIENRVNNSSDLKIFNYYDENKNELNNLIKHKIQLIKINNSTTKNGNKDFSFPEELINEIIEKGKTHRVLVICNTIKQAQNVYSKIKEKLNNNSFFTLLHSRFTFDDRKRIQDIIQSEFSNPKPENENKGKILVATQVIEAAIDIDADILYTELAPLDVLIQRMGRILRRHRNNFIYEGPPNVNILIFEDTYQSGSFKVYDKEILELSLILLLLISNKEIEHSDSDSITQKAQEFFEYKDYGNLKRLKLKENFKNKLNSIQDFSFYSGVKKNRKSELAQNMSFYISEYQKYQLTNVLYSIIDRQSNYMKDFYDTIRILDAGFMADTRQEAQKIFRNMVTTSVISKSKLDDLKNDLTNFFTKFNNSKRIYTLFKEYIISRYVIDVIGVKERHPLKKVELWIDENLSINQQSNITQQNILKIKRWMKNIFITDAEYSSEIGLSQYIEENIQSNFI